MNPADPILAAHADRLRAGPKHVRLDRPCTLGDGVDTLPETRRAVELPITHFVPASGAATRLFQAMRATLDASVPDMATLRTLATGDRTDLAPALRALDGWGDLALSRALPDTHPEADLPGLLRALQESGWATRPKGLIPFHTRTSEWHTAIDGHLYEAAALQPEVSVVRMHLTAPTAHLEPFRDTVEAAAARIGAELGRTFQVALSVQDPQTDTPALGPDGELVVQDGALFRRAGGHGALLSNLDGHSGLILIKNVDNMAHADRRPDLIRYRRRLLEALADLVETHAALVRRLRDGAGGAAETARAWLSSFGVDGSTDPEVVLRDLDRPLRIAGVVINDGQPGGGPFWVRDATGNVTAQIVESVEVDHDDPDQQAAWQGSTHFNPVDMACWLSDVDGRPHDLMRFVDPDRWIVTNKVHDGLPVRALEYPGLWNGSMSGWLTRFVALPRETFNPVKTLGDLLNERHRPM